MTKYIVKNCPATTGTNGFCGDDRKELFCDEITDCLIKQVIEKCKQVECPCELKGIDCLECGENRRKTFADDILKLFEIEECE